MFGVLFEVLVMVRVHVCEIDGWVLWECCSGSRMLLRCWWRAWRFCEIDGEIGGRALGGMQLGDSCAGATMQSLARVSLSGVYAGVIL